MWLGKERHYAGNDGERLLAPGSGMPESTARDWKGSE
nr:unnamed protein product [Digitaria exilis]